MPDLSPLSGQLDHAHVSISDNFFPLPFLIFFFAYSKKEKDRTGNLSPFFSRFIVEIFDSNGGNAYDWLDEPRFRTLVFFSERIVVGRNFFSIF